MALAACLYATAANADDQTKEEKDESFLQGLEQGFFLRNDDDGYKQFDCPELHVDASFQKRFNQVLAPAELMVGMSDNDQMKSMWDGVSLFIQEVAAFQAIIDNYQASDFCQGVQFGVHGSRLIVAGGKHILSDL